MAQLPLFSWQPAQKNPAQKNNAAREDSPLRENGSACENSDSHKSSVAHENGRGLLDRMLQDFFHPLRHDIDLVGPQQDNADHEFISTTTRHDTRTALLQGR